MQKIIQDHRMLMSWVIGLLAITYIVFSAHPTGHEYFYETLEVVGFILISFASFGRIWCAVYISGFKSKKLITDGPYSIARNPLYIFSYLGVMGICLGTGCVLLAIVLTPLYVWSYSVTIRKEEEALRLIFGAEFDAYAARTPRILPSIGQYWSRDRIEVVPKKLFRSMMDAMCFVWFIILIEVFEQFHHLIPPLFSNSF